MCGIAGIVSLTGKPINRANERIHHMLGFLKHRGPDAEGVYISDDRLLALGNNRLAIVDVATRFSLPIRSAEKDAVLAFNGEIFNYHAVRDQLKQRGVAFQTHSDTEVFLHTLKHWGTEGLKRLDGFWSFAYYGVREHALFLGRDLLGEKHLFYWKDSQELIFASEINAVLAARNDSFSIDFDSVVSSFRYRAAPPGKTLVQGVNRLEPGFTLRVTPGSSHIREVRSLRLMPEKWFDFFAANPSEAEVLKVYESTLWEACRQRIPQEVGYMATLSGGLDSALVNVYASDFGKRPISTLYGSSSVISPQRDNDLSEEAASRFTSQKLKTQHTEFNMIAEDCVPYYRQQAANAFDGLFCEGSIAFHQLSEHVKQQGNRVLLLSDGPDELLSGYERDIKAYQRYIQLNSRPLIRNLLQHFQKNSWLQSWVSKSTVGDWLNFSCLKQDPFFFRPAHAGTSPEVLERLFGKSAFRRSDGCYGTLPSDYWGLAQQLGISQAMSLSYATQSLPDYYNLRTDRAVMRSSVEARLPLQAPALVELMIATPERWRFCNGRGKYLFRHLVNRFVGPEIAFRSKYGFAQPAWMNKELEKRMDLREVVGDSSIFSDLPFLKGSRDFLLRPEEGRHRWMGYSLALVYDRLKRGDYETV